MNFDITKIKFIPRSHAEPFDILEYKVDINTLAVLYIPASGYKEFEIKRGRGIIEDSKISPYYQRWVQYIVPPRFKPISIAMDFHYTTYLQSHTCTPQEDSICFVCSSRKKYHNTDALLLDRILSNKISIS